MNNQLFYVPILPKTGPGSEVQSVPYNALEFWPMVNIVREVMYKYQSRIPENFDLPRLGKDKKFDEQVVLYIHSKWGNKNVSIIWILFFPLLVLY